MLLTLLHRNPWTGRSAVVLVALVALTAPLAAPESAGATGSTVTFRNTRIYATSGWENALPDRLVAVDVDRSGNVVRKALVSNGAGGRATDAASGRVLFQKGIGLYAGREIWVRNRSGSTRRLTDGELPIFTRDSSGVLFIRYEPPDPEDEFGDSTAFLHRYRLSDGSTEKLASLGQVLVTAVQLSPGGRELWILRLEWETYATDISSYVMATGAVRSSALWEDHRWCSDLAVLPDGKRLVVICPARVLRTVRVSDLVVTATTRQRPPNTIYQLHGRLTDRELLATFIVDGRHKLGAFDGRTFALRRLIGSQGLAYGVTEHD